MKTFHNTAHHLHAGKQEMFRGKLVDCHEVPNRLEYVLSELQRRGLGDIVAPQTNLPLHPPLQVALQAGHSRPYLDFLAGAWEQWLALDSANTERDALPSVWPLAQPHAFRTDTPPLNFAARLGQYAFDSGTPLTAGSWPAARQGAAAQAVLAGERAAFALTRPPGHHAGPAFMGGYAVSEVGMNVANVLEDFGA